MLLFITRRLLNMALTMVVVAALLFLLFEVDKASIAIKALGQFSSEEQRAIWLEAHGYNDPLWERYFLGHCDRRPCQTQPPDKQSNDDDDPDHQGYRHCRDQAAKGAQTGWLWRLGCGIGTGHGGTSDH